MNHNGTRRAGTHHTAAVNLHHPEKIALFRAGTEGCRAIKGGKTHGAELDGEEMQHRGSI